MDMLERATSALQKAWDEGGVDGSMLPPFTFTDAEAKYLVRAVLTAIREPSIALVMAGANEVENGDGELHRRKWQAMIDAIIGYQGGE